MKRILIINHCDPFGIGGGCFASHAYVKAFSEISNGNIDVCIFAESKTQIDESIRVNQYIRVPSRPLWKRLASFLTGDIERYKSFIKHYLEKTYDNYSIVVFNGSFEGGALVDIALSYNLKTITIHHNFDPKYAYENCKYQEFFRRIYRYHVFQLQKKSYKCSDVNLFLTNQDMEMCKKEYGTTIAKNSLIGVFEFKELIEKIKPKNGQDDLTFVITGSLCTVQGVDGIKYFFNELYSFVPKTSRIIIAGRNPNDIVTFLCNQHDNVTLVPNPRDINEVISSGDVYICPTRFGSGLKLRVMDGLRLGLPVITHSCSARGYDAFCDSVIFQSFDSPQEFRNAVNNITFAYSEGKVDKKTVYKKYKETFSYESGVNRLKDILSELKYIV